MAVFDSPASTYSDTTTHKRVVTDVISLIDPTDTPLIAAIGGLDGAAGKFRFVNWPGKTVEWLEDTHLPLTSAMTTASVTSTGTSITVADASLFQPGYVILIDTEYIWVSSADTATNVLTVVRDATNNASHTSTAAITMVGMARLEGAESNPIAFTDRTVGSNHTQIFHQEVKVTRSHSRLSQYGVANEMAYQKDKAIPHLMRLIERHLLYNTVAATGTTTSARVMGGIRAFVTTNKADGASLTQAKIESAVLSTYNNGGSGQLAAIMSPTYVQKIKNFYDSVGAGLTSAWNNTVLQVGQDTREVGMLVNKVVTPFGNVDIVMDRWSPSGYIYFLDLTNVGMLTYDPFAWEDLAKTGDYERSEVVGEFTFCLRQELTHALLTNVS